MDFAEAFVAPGGGERWFIFINVDGERHTIGSLKGYNTYHEGFAALLDLRGEGAAMTAKQEARMRELMAAPYALPKRDRKLLAKLLRLAVSQQARG